MKPNPIRKQHWLALAGLVAVTACLAVAGRHIAPLPAENGRASAPGPEPAPPHASAAAPGVEPARSHEPAPAPGAERAPSHAPAPAPDPASAPSGTAGRVIAIDPETGQPGAPTPAQLRALRLDPLGAAASRTEEGLLETRLPNGTVTVQLDERFHEHVITRVGKDGRVTYGCAHHHDGLEKALRDSTAAPTLEVE